MENSPSQQSPTTLEAGASNTPASIPLERKHDELDILKGCPRNIVVDKLDYSVRAFKNDEFSRVGILLLNFGFSSCTNEQEAAEISIEEIYTNLVLLGSQAITSIGYASIQDFLVSFFKPVGHEYGIDIDRTEDSTFREMLAILIEQNNLLSYAKKNAARLIKLSQKT